jgi:hypothetical protein
MPTTVLVGKATCPKNTWCSEKKEKQFTFGLLQMGALTSKL